MKILGIGLGLCLFAAGLPASTIDVSYQATQSLQSGDSLVFDFSGRSFATITQSQGLSLYPTQIAFNFASAPVASDGEFTAMVESADGSASALFPDSLSWTSGMALGAPASIIAGCLTLSSDLSREIFSGQQAELILTYLGPDVTVGVTGASLKRDLNISLIGDSFSIGALDSGVWLTRSDEPMVKSAAAPAPESGSGAMLAVAAAALYAISKTIKGFSKLRD